MRITPLVFTALFLCSCTSPSTEPSTNFVDDKNGLVDPTGQVFTQVCEDGKEQDGPWNNDLVLNWLDDEGRTVGEEETLVEGGGVPTVIQDATGRLVAAFQWFPCDNKEAFDKVAVSFSDDEGKTWSEPTPIVVNGLPESYARPFDPTLSLIDDGRIRIYYTSSAEGQTAFGDDTNIYSAISEDGLNYTFEEGVRFDLDGLAAYDSAVGYWDGLWHIVTPNDIPVNFAGAHHATSSDGLTFTQTDDLTFDSEVNWTGNFLVKKDGLYFYGTPAKGANWWTKTDDGIHWDEPVYLQTHGGDPAIACPEDDCFMISVQMSKLDKADKK